MGGNRNLLLLPGFEFCRKCGGRSCFICFPNYESNFRCVGGVKIHAARWVMRTFSMNEGLRWRFSWMGLFSDARLSDLWLAWFEICTRHLHLSLNFQGVVPFGKFIGKQFGKCSNSGWYEKFGSSWAMPKICGKGNFCCHTLVRKHSLCLTLCCW